MQTVARKMLFCDKTSNFAVANHANCVEHSISMKDWKTHCRQQTPSLREQPLQLLPRRLPHVRCQKHVLATITRHTQFRQTQHLHLLVTRLPQHLLYPLQITVPVQWRLIDDRGTQPEFSHEFAQKNFECR